MFTSSSLPHPNPPPGLPVTKSSASLPSPIDILCHTNPTFHPSTTELSLVPLSLSHTPSLWTYLGGQENDGLYTYMPGGPYATYEEFKALIQSLIACWVGSGELAYAVVISSPLQASRPLAQVSSDHLSTDLPKDEAVKEGTAVGIIRLLNIRPSHLSVEIGYVLFSKRLQKTVEASMVFYMLTRHVVEELGFERVEWKCNALNEGSKKAALRLGFVEEGLFRRHLVIKGVWRDTWWGSILGDEWRGDGEAEGKRSVKEMMERWLDASNFDKEGLQKRKMESFRIGT